MSALIDRALGVARRLRASLRSGTQEGSSGRSAQSKRTERMERKRQREFRRRMGRGVAAGDYPEEPRDPPQERIETAQQRQLPNFMIIGAQRGGTTSLYRYLTEHLDVGPAFRKEVHFFDRYYEKGMDWYRAHFPLRGEYPVVGEASPYYLFHPGVPERVRRMVPDAAFIVLLRNPVDRAYSSYHMKVRRGIETLSFEDALDKERERLSEADDPVSLARRHYSYVARGLYAEQLERWMSVFPRERFLVLKSEDLYREPARVLDQTFEYLGLAPTPVETFKAFHASEYEDLDPATRERLAAYFAPHNERLYDLLGRNMGWELGE